MDIKKVTNYKAIAENLRKITNCKVSIKILSGDNHFHFGLTDEDDLPIGVVCYDKSIITFAPFRRVDENFSNDEYISFVFAPLTEKFCEVFKALSNMVIQN